MKQFAALLACVPLVAAHGFVQNAMIGGKEHDVIRTLSTTFSIPLTLAISFTTSVAIHPLLYTC
jgi:hypothetical protein